MYAEKEPKYKSMDGIDLEEVTRDYLKHFTSVSFEKLQEFGRKLERVGKLRGSHGYV